MPLGRENHPEGEEFVVALRDVAAQGDPEKTLAYFMQDMPPEWFQGMRNGPDWPLFARMAPTCVVDAEALAWTQSAPRRELWQEITIPAYVLVGPESPDFFHAAAASIVDNLAHAENVPSPGSGHRWEAAEMADALEVLLRR